MLMLIAYYSNPVKRVDNKNSIDKSSDDYRRFVKDNVSLFLDEIESYEGFSQKDIVIDINTENTDMI